MAEQDFAGLAKAKNLEEETIELLKEKKYETEEALSLMTGDQLNDLDISDKQRKALKDWLVELYVQFNREQSIPEKNQDNPTFDLTVTDEDGKESRPSKEPEYEEPGSPRPSIYQNSINVAMVGQISAGKSSLINALRGLTPKDPNAASTEIGAKKEGMVPYKFNKVDTMILWDLPAVEDISEEYLKKVEFDQYDAIVVCSAERLSEWDVWLATVAAKGELKTFIVRTKIDRDIESDKDDYGEEHDEEKLKERIRQDISSQVTDADVYLISSKQPHWESYDFPKLATNIAGVTKRTTKANIFNQDDTEKTSEPAANDITEEAKPKDGASKKSKRGGSKKDKNPESEKLPELTELEKLEKKAEDFKKEIPSVVAKAAKKGSVDVLKKEVDKYKKDFKVDLPELNLDSLEEAVDKEAPEPPKGFKAKVMSCFGGRSQGALSAEALRKVFDIISDGAPDQLESIINSCKEAAIKKLDK